MPNTRAVSISVAVGVGSRYEEKEQAGISHFLEHMFFKGTKNRPDAKQLNSDLDKIGAAYNAYTTKEHTGFWIKSAADHFDYSLEIISDIVLNPLFKKDELERERKVILQELAMFEDDPQRKVYDILENTIFKGHAVGRDILGTRETVSSIKRKDLVDYKNENYRARNTVVAIAGDINVDDAFKKAEKIFSLVPNGKTIRASKAQNSQKNLRLKIVNKDLDQTHMALAFWGYDLHSVKKYPLILLSVMLGGNSSSKLFMEIREKLGLAYSVGSWAELCSDYGYLGLSMGVAHDKLSHALEKVMSICFSLKDKGVTKKSLALAKSFIKGRNVLDFETSDEIASYLAGQELFYNKVIQPEEFMANIEKVNQNDILKVAREIFNPAKANLAVIGKQTEEEKYKKIFSKLN